LTKCTASAPCQFAYPASKLPMSLQTDCAYDLTRAAHYSRQRVPVRSLRRRSRVWTLWQAPCAHCHNLVLIESRSADKPSRPLRLASRHRCMCGCWTCGRVILRGVSLGGRRTHARYCGPACRQQAYRDRKEAQRQGRTLNAWRPKRRSSRTPRNARLGSMLYVLSERAKQRSD